MSSFNEIRQSTRGMTLVEVMVVIAILALVATFIVPRWLLLSRNRDTVICRSNIALINAAASAYLSDMHTPADGLPGLVEHGYLKEIPRCASGRQYAFNGFYVVTTRDHDH